MVLSCCNRCLQRPNDFVAHILSLVSHPSHSRLSSHRQGYLMKQSKLSSRWKPFYFRLDDGYLACYEKKSLLGTSPSKVITKNVVPVPSCRELKFLKTVVAHVSEDRNKRFIGTSKHTAQYQHFAVRWDPRVWCLVSDASALLLVLLRICCFSSPARSGPRLASLHVNALVCVLFQGVGCLGRS